MTNNKVLTRINKKETFAPVGILGFFFVGELMMQNSLNGNKKELENQKCKIIIIKIVVLTFTEFILLA